MAFIPNPEIKGQIKVLARDINVLKGTITKGSRVEILGTGPRGYNIRDLESGVEAHEVSEAFGKGPVFEE